MFTTFDRYLLRRYLHTFVILFISMYGLFVVIDGFTNIDAFQEGQTSATGALKAMGWYYLYQTSVFFDLIGAMLSVITVMVLFALLKKQGEVIPILAAGIPTYRLIAPCVVGTIIVSGLVALNQEWIIPSIASFLQTPRGAEASEGKHVDPITDYRTHIRIYGQRLFVQDQRIDGANFVLPVPDAVSELTSLDAQHALYKPPTDSTPGGWLLQGVKQNYAALPLTDSGREIIFQRPTAGELFVASDVTFDQIYNRARSYKYCSTPELIRRIQNPTFGNVTLRSQILHLHLRLVTPLGNLLSIFVAVPLVLRRESRSLITNMALCAGVLGCLHGLVQVTTYLGRANLVAPDMAAWIPIVAAGALAAWLSAMVQT